VAPLSTWDGHGSPRWSSQTPRASGCPVPTAVGTGEEDHPPSGARTAQAVGRRGGWRRASSSGEGAAPPSFARPTYLPRLRTFKTYQTRLWTWRTKDRGTKEKRETKENLAQAAWWLPPCSGSSQARCPSLLAAHHRPLPLDQGTKRGTGDRSRSTRHGTACGRRITPCCPGHGAEPDCCSLLACKCSPSPGSKASQNHSVLETKGNFKVPVQPFYRWGFYRRWAEPVPGRDLWPCQVVGMIPGH